MKKLLVGLALASSLSAQADNTIPESVADVIIRCDSGVMARKTSMRPVERAAQYNGCMAYVGGVIDGVVMARYASGVKSCLPVGGVSRSGLLAALKGLVLSGDVQIDDSARVSIATIVLLASECE